MSPTRSPTIRTRLAILVLASAIPAVVLGVIWINYNYQSGRAQVVRSALGAARATSTVVDSTVTKVQSALFALASSPALETNDLDRFYRQAKEALTNQDISYLVLVEKDGLQRLNTLRPFGEPLPFANGQSELQAIFTTGKPVITSILVGAVSQRQVFAIGVPVKRGATIAYGLNAVLYAEQISGILARQQLLPDWITTIFDKKGQIVGRSRDADRFVGQPISAALIRQIGNQTEGVLDVDAIDGVPVLAAFRQSTVSGWTVGITVPQQSLTSGLWGALWPLISASMVIIVGSFALAFFLGGRISRSVRSLVAPALAIGAGPIHAVPSFHLREADEVGAALHKASLMLAEAEFQANHDILTGLANRGLFKEIVSQQLEVCKRTGTKLAVLFIDLDGFKVVNDNHGHIVGDELLRLVAQRLSEAIRSSDIAARLGGDEFAIVLMHVRSDDAPLVAAKLVEVLSVPYTVGDLRIEISASIGVAEYPVAATTLETLIQRADEAMYKAKGAGKRRYCLA